VNEVWFFFKGMGGLKKKTVLAGMCVNSKLAAGLGTSELSLLNQLHSIFVVHLYSVPTQSFVIEPSVGFFL
jgi:hypothetical protein